MTIRRLLVANRGEIARRVFRTAKEMGIFTVAVHSDGDRDAPFVSDADLGVALGGTTATESYLDGEKFLPRQFQLELTLFTRAMDSCQKTLTSRRQ